MNKKFRSKKIIILLVLIFLFISTFSIIKIDAYSSNNLPLISNPNVYQIINSYTVSSGHTYRVQSEYPSYILDNYWTPSSTPHSPDILGRFYVNYNEHLIYYLLHYYSNGFDYILLSTSTNSLQNTIYLYGNNSSIKYSVPSLTYVGGDLVALTGIAYYVPYWYDVLDVFSGYITLNYSLGYASDEIFSLLELDYINYITYEYYNYNKAVFNDYDNSLDLYQMSGDTLLYHTHVDLSYYEYNEIDVSLFYSGLVQLSSFSSSGYIREGRDIIPIKQKESNLIDLFNATINVPIIYLHEILSFSILDVNVFSIFVTILSFIILIGVIGLIFKPRGD